MEGLSAILVGAPVTATGGVTAAPLGTAMPEDATTALSAAFAKLGYVSEDGVTKSVDASDEKIKAWGGDVVRIVRQDHSVAYALTFLESANATLLKEIYGEESSPRTRGSSLRGDGVALDGKVVPAHAGVIRAASAAEAQELRRPRARGGHPH